MTVARDYERRRQFERVDNKKRSMASSADVAEAMRVNPVIAEALSRLIQERALLPNELHLFPDAQYEGRWVK